MKNITTRTTIVSNVQFDDSIRIWLLEEEGLKSAPETLRMSAPKQQCSGLQCSVDESTQKIGNF